MARATKTTKTPAKAAKSVSGGKDKSSKVVKATPEDISKYGIDPATAALNSLMSSEFEALEKKYEMVGGSMHSLDKISSDCLVLDLITGGGFTPTGINQMAGFEASGKTTTILHTTGRALTERKIAYVGVNDAENTFDTDYLEGIFGPKFDTELMAKLRYSDQNILEYYFDFVRGVIRTLPDKIWNDDIGSFVYRFKNKQAEHTKLIGRMTEAGMKSDKALSVNGYTIFPTSDTSPQALFILDSFPALITEGSDERESDEGGGMSERARKLAEILPRFTGRMRRKGVGLVGVNQLRERPGAPRGSDPTYEPMGNVLKFASAQRNRVTSRSSKSYNESFKIAKNASQLVVEDNPLGGRDFYAFKEFRNTKNKAGTPFLRGWCRIWTADPNGKGHGIDAAFDLWEYMSLTGQVQGSRLGKKGFKVTIPGVAKNLGSEDPISWHTFKLLVYAEKYGGAYLAAAKEAGFKRPPKLLALAWAQRGTKASQLYADRLKAKPTKTKDLSDEE